MDEAVRTRLLERVRREFDLQERMAQTGDRTPGQLQYLEELRATIEALSTGCGAGQHDYAVREGHPPLYCRRCGGWKQPDEPERKGFLAGVPRDALEREVKRQEQVIVRQVTSIEALHEAEARLIRQRDELRQQVDSQVITSAISDSERERYVKQIGQLVGERDRLKEQSDGFLRQLIDRNTQITELKGMVQRLTSERDSARDDAKGFEQQLNLAEDAAKRLKAGLESARQFRSFGNTVTVRDPDPELKRRIEDLEQQLGRMQVARDMASEQLASLRRSIRGFARQHAP